MVISHLIGGLGNQMFQYAAGRAVSLRMQTPLRLDTVDFRRYGLHQGFELERVFNISAEVAQATDVRGMLRWQCSPRIRQFVSRPGMARIRNKALIIEPSFSYWQGIRDVPDNCYLVGYWQTEKYFKEAAETIRKDFSFDLPLSEINADLTRQIAGSSAIGLHVRRGDYVSNSSAAATYSICSLEYYRSAIKHIANHVEHPNFFIFSDDIAWAKENLHIDFSHQYVGHNTGADSYVDMRLMSLCKHNIIANSSFSWWGAWLNANQNKIVVAPERWFANGLAVHDLLPDSWVTL
jgi:hypothetical protein